MLGFSPFYNGLLRKYVIYFGTLFNNITIQRFDSEGNVFQNLPVPLMYAPNSKVIDRITEFEDLQKRDVAITLPRMSFEIVTLGYDASRKIGTMNQNINSSGGASQFVPVPYNINFLLSIYVKNQEDGSKIVEQILPFFTPDFTSKLNLIPALGTAGIVDVPLTLNNITIRDTFEGTGQTTRYIIWSLTFQMQVNFSGPVTSPSLIKQVIVNIHDDYPVGTPIDETITVQPGLLANGSPTTNSALSIPYTQINANNDFGFCVDITGDS